MIYLYVICIYEWLRRGTINKHDHLNILTEHMAGDLAISVRGAEKSYGRGAKRTRVLTDFSMSVPTGNIYGLLGRNQLFIL